MNRITVHFRGHVQGVGFRYSVCQIAKPINVTGYVKNLEDQSVELIAEGPKDALSQLVDQIRKQLANHIREHTIEDSPATGEFGTFNIAY